MTPDLDQLALPKPEEAGPEKVAAPLCLELLHDLQFLLVADVAVDGFELLVDSVWHPVVPDDPFVLSAEDHVLPSQLESKPKPHAIKHLLQVSQLLRVGEQLVPNSEAIPSHNWLALLDHDDLTDASFFPVLHVLSKGLEHFRSQLALSVVVEDSQVLFLLLLPGGVCLEEPHDALAQKIDEHLASKAIPLLFGQAALSVGFECLERLGELRLTDVLFDLLVLSVQILCFLHEQHPS